MVKKFKKIDENTIEEIDTAKTPKVLHNIEALKKQREFLLEELRKIEEILKAVGEL